jgi:alkanesulfonate monooxygenase SsuD/methylene tetrahydromethanopterin reductase-like flavin-dependent oxidoreductase (luciferase family)
MLLNLRFDFNSPEFGAPRPQLYRAAIEQARWADRLGFHQVLIAEHHGTEGGWVPSPLTFAGAVLGATEQIVAHVWALLVPFYNPLRLAEDLAVLDNIAPGRIRITAGLGYRGAEFEMFGIDKSKRLAILTEAMDTLTRAWTGEPFEHQGRTVTVTPKPATPGGPKFYMAGSTEASALRTARQGYQYNPVHPDLFAIYAEERAKLGMAPPEPFRQTVARYLFVSDDPERDWPRIGPHIAYDATTVSGWSKEIPEAPVNYQAAETIEALKAMNDEVMILTPDQCLGYLHTLDKDAAVVLNPLCGGLDPDTAWDCLRLFEAEVLPQLRSEGLIEPRLHSNPA